MLPLVLALAAAADASPSDVRGTYRVEATVRSSGVPLLRTLELRGDVLLRPGEDPGAVSARLASRGQSCELAATLRDGEALRFEPGQRCRIALDDPGVRGDVLATLRAGRGRVADGRLTLELELELAGEVRIATGRVPGLAAETAVPVDGDATILAEGRRDNSRAAELRD